MNQELFKQALTKFFAGLIAVGFCCFFLHGRFGILRVGF